MRSQNNSNKSLNNQEADLPKRELAFGQVGFRIVYWIICELGAKCHYVRPLCALCLQLAPQLVSVFVFVFFIYVTSKFWSCLWCCCWFCGNSCKVW